MIKRETAVLAASDLHYGKRTVLFGVDAYRRGLAAIRERVAGAIRGRGDRVVDELVILFLGDVVDGHGIYPTQGHHQEITDPQEQARQWAEHMAGEMAALQKEAAVPVQVRAVAGNHGRAGKHHAESSNFDLLAYDFLRLHTEREGIGVDVGKGDQLFLRTVPLRGPWKALLYHGQGVRSYQGIPFYGLRQRVLHWHTTGLGPFDVALFGHFHSMAYTRVNRVHLLLTGTMAAGDTWALEQFGSEGANAWWLFGCSDDRLFTWQEQIPTLPA